MKGVVPPFGVVGEFLTICASVSLVILWLTKASSLALLMLLSFSISTALLFSVIVPKLPLVMVVLGLGGGLFVLIAFVILSHPWDLKEGVSLPLKTTFGLVSLVVALSWSGEKGACSPQGWGEKWMPPSVGSFVVVYVFLILLLVVFLLPLNEIMNQSDGSVYSDKKSKGL